MNNLAFSVAEHFASIQGEGPSAGILAYFIRMSGCPLDCHFCDTKEVWKRGSLMQFQEMLDAICLSGMRGTLERDLGHLVFTGGDPLLQQSRLNEFMKYFHLTWNFIPFVEVETEAFITPSSSFMGWVHQWNVSPKLSNSGIPEERRINRDALQWHAKQTGSWFKFAVLQEADVVEALELVGRYRIAQARVSIMPICGSRAEQDARGAQVAQWAMKYRVSYSPRLQLQLWDKSTGC